MKDIAIKYLKGASDLNANEIISVLQKADDQYTNDGESFISDSEYDKLRLLAQRNFPTHEYFIGVGSSVRRDKVKLPFQMGSLDQVQVGELNEFLKAKKITHENFVASDKMDGVSAMLVYNENGELQIAFSRGDGIEGQDITRHIKEIPSVPKKISGTMTVRCEVEFSDTEFEKVKLELTRNDGTPYKNARNAVAGFLNGETVKQKACRHMTLFAYEIMGSDLSKSEQFSKLESENFVVVSYKLFKAGEITEASLKNLIAERKSKLDYAIDGIVVDIDDPTGKTQKRLNAENKSDSLNPATAFKYKINNDDDAVETEVLDVEYNLSKHGYAKPKVKLRPVDIQGVTVSNTTGFNAKYIMDNKIGKGAIVKMIRSGDVIPYIKEVIKPADKAILPKNMDDYVWSENEVDLVLKDTSNNDAIKLKQLISWATALDIPLLKEGSIKELMVRGYNTPESIANLTQPTFEAIVGKNGNKIYKGIHKVFSSIKVEKLVGSWPEFGVGIGVRKIKKLVDSINKDQLTVDDVKNLNKVDYKNVEGWDDKTFAKFNAKFNDFLKYLENINHLVTIEKPESFYGGKLSGERICFTGFRDSTLEEIIVKNGGEMVSGVSKKTTIVVAQDPDSVSGKTEKARELGIKLVSKLEFEKLIDKVGEEKKSEKDAGSNFFEYGN